MLNNSMALLHVSHHPVQTYRVRTSYIFNIAWTLWVLDPITNPSFGRAPAAPCYNKTSSWFLNRNTASQVSMARNVPTNEKQRWATKTTLPIKSLNCNGRYNKEFPRQKKAKRILLPQTSIAGDTKGTAIRRGRIRAHAWVEGLVHSRGPVRGNHTLMFLSLSFPLRSPLSKNK